MNETMKRFSINDFLDVLPPSTRAAAYQAYEGGIDLMVLAEQMASEPSAGLATKGGVFWPNDILQQIGRELHALLCTNDARYEAARRKLRAEGSASAKVFVLLASSAVAASVNFTVALCVPFVAMILAAIAKITIEAWCKSVLVPQTVVTSADTQNKASEPVEPSNAA
jgi:hypothetical protein